MFHFLSEKKRRQHPSKPSVLTWYLCWSVDEIHCEFISFLLSKTKVPALLCTEIAYIRKYAPPGLMRVVCDPVDAYLRPIDGWGWFECLTELEQWALDFNEVDR